MAALVLRIKGAEPVGVEVPDHLADPVLAGERDLGDRGHTMPWADTSTGQGVRRGGNQQVSDRIG
jgi:hypothetical protein